MEGIVVYILQCADNTLYTGWTNNFEKRMREHKKGSASKYTRSRLPFQVVYQERANSKSDALKRERAIKKMTRKAKLAMILGEK